MGYDRCMGYGPCFPAYQVGNTKTLWGIAEYGFSGIWFIRESTVVVQKTGPTVNTTGNAARLNPKPIHIVA